MITVIDHRIRQQLDISSVHYMVAEACAFHKNIWSPTTIHGLAQELGLSTRAVSVAVDELRTCQPALLEIAENGSIYPTKHWYLAQIQETQITTVDTQLAKEVIVYFNEVNETRYQLPNNMELIKAILKASPKLTMDHFKSVIIHKKETWGNDEKMAEYNRPSTIFGSPRKFLKYLDDATMYWNSK